MSTTRKSQAVNGVDVDQLMEAVRNMRKDPQLGQFQFRARNKWQTATRNETEMRDYYGAGEEHQHDHLMTFRHDEPKELVGTDNDPNPVEWVLHALAGCVTTTMACHAASRGIEIQSIESELEGDIDVRGFLGIAEDVPKGYQRVRVKMRVRSDATPEQLEELARMSPVYNTLSNPLDVQLTVEKA